MLPLQRRAAGEPPAQALRMVRLDAGTVKALFVSDAYGQPGYVMLRETAPDDASPRGGENGAEMGVFNRVGAPFKRDGLNAKIAEYMPFGLAPVTVIQT
ncbi:MAG: hypothetical protein HND48_21875 [Chloroflexi bacterium]|nr:hypothetical protein [Chloroflexota bacterium]